MPLPLARINTRQIVVASLPSQFMEELARARSASNEEVATSPATKELEQYIPSARHCTQTASDAFLVKLSTAQSQSLEADGFVVVPGVFSELALQLLRRSFERLEEQAKELSYQILGAGKVSMLHRGAQFVLERTADSCKIHRVLWRGAADPILLDFASDKRFMDLSQQVLGEPDAGPWLSQALIQLPGDPDTCTWQQDIHERLHQDPLWQAGTNVTRYAQIAAVLDPTGGDPGMFEFVRASHHGGELDASSFEEVVRKGDVVCPQMEPGDVVVYGPYVLRRMAPNASGRLRRAYLGAYTDKP